MFLKKNPKNPNTKKTNTPPPKHQQNPTTQCLPCFSCDYQLLLFKIDAYCKLSKLLCLCRLLCKQTKQATFVAMSFCAPPPLISNVVLFHFKLYKHMSTTLWRTLSFHEHGANYDKDFPLFLMVCVTLDRLNSYPPFTLLTGSNNNLFICPSICGSLTCTTMPRLVFYSWSWPAAEFVSYPRVFFAFLTSIAMFPHSLWDFRGFFCA